MMLQHIISWILFYLSLYFTPGRLSNPGFAISSLPACTSLKSPGLGEEHPKPAIRSLNRKSRWGTQRAIALCLCCGSPSRSSRDSTTLMSNQPSTHYSRRNKRARHRRSTVDQVILLTHKWGMSLSVACECGAEAQTVDHVDSNVQSTSPWTTRPDCCGDETIEWLLNTCPEI